MNILFKKLQCRCKVVVFEIDQTKEKARGEKDTLVRKCTGNVKK